MNTKLQIKPEVAKTPLSQNFSQEAASLLKERKTLPSKGHHCQGGGGWH